MSEIELYLSFISMIVKEYSYDKIRRYVKQLEQFEDVISVRSLADSALKLGKSDISDETETDYSALFEGTDCEISVPLWESSYVNERDALLDKTTLSVIQIYLKYNLFPNEGGQPADYIRFETDFLLYLIKHREFIEAKNFFSEHYFFFASELFKKIKIFAVTEFYNNAAEFAIKSLSVIRKKLFLLNPTEQRIDTEIPISFRKISQSEKEELLELHVVKTAGRGNCGGSCRINAYVQAGCVLKLVGAQADSENECMPIPCVRGRGYRKTFLSSNRIRYPMIRAGERGSGKFKRITWEEAEDILYKKLEETKHKYGAGSRFVHYGSGESCYLRGDRLAKKLLALDGGYLGHYNSYSAACAEIIIPYIYGTFETTPSWDTHKNSKLIILWGFNPVVTTHNTGVLQALKDIKERGIPVISIDPRYTDTTAIFATEWIPVYPGTDGALASAVAYVIIKENLYDKEFIDKFCIGFDSEHMPDGYENEETFFDYILGKSDGTPKTPEWASNITGVKEDVIIELARKLGTTKPAAILTGWGMQRQLSGEQQIRMLAALSCLTGNVGINGGSTGVRGMPHKHNYPIMRMPENPYHAEIPSFLWTKAIVCGEEMTDYDDAVRGRKRLESSIKLIINIAGNTLLNQHSDINKTAEILKDTSKCEFIVVSDVFMTPSAKYADLLLPAVSMFEEDYIALPKAEANYMLYGNKAIEPIFEARSEFDWLKSLAEKMNIEDFTEGCQTRREWFKKMYDELRPKEKELPDFEEFAANGGYFYKDGGTFIPFKEQVEDFEHHKFPTQSGKIEIFSERLFNHNGKDKISAIPKYEPHNEELINEDSEFPIRLIGGHTKRRWHSVGDNNAWLEAVEPHKLWINAQDAKERGITEDSEAVVFNERGAIRIKAHVTNRIMQGVACIPQGAWYLPDKNNSDIRGSVNTLTTLTPTPIARGNSQHSIFVEIKNGDKS